jgi:phosphopentomutase
MRAVLVEAGHRCAISTCKATTTEIHHIIPFAETQNNNFENLIALCPNCHARYHKGEIDEKAIRMYKANLSILNHRYGEFERRIFDYIVESGERVIVVGAGGDILLYNAIKDGFLEDKNVQGISLSIKIGNEFEKKFPLSFTYWVTDKGLEFIKRYSEGNSIE